jgi:hypothetical protein
MKITNAEVIKSGEKDLIDSITADLDWGAIENIFLTEHNLGIDEDIEYKRGDIIACNNQVAYKLEFTVKVNLSVLINRDGEYLSVKISEKKDHNASGGFSGYTNPAEVEESTENDVIEQKEESAADVKVVSVDNSEKQYTNSERAGKEDRYFEALEQIGSNDSENPVDAVKQDSL